MPTTLHTVPHLLKIAGIKETRVPWATRTLAAAGFEQFSIVGEVRTRCAFSGDPAAMTKVLTLASATYEADVHKGRVERARKMGSSNRESGKYARGPSAAKTVQQLRDELMQMKSILLEVANSNNSVAAALGSLDTVEGK